MKKIFFLVAVCFAFAGTVYAHQPVRENLSQSFQKGSVIDFSLATEISDPTEKSLAVYGAIEKPNEIDLYKFTAKKDEEIPVEVLVPVRVSNENFEPSFVFIENGSGVAGELPFQIENGFSASLVSIDGERDIFFEPFSIEKLYHGNEQKFEVKSGQTYYIAIFEPNGFVGDYSLGIGTVEDFSNTSFTKLIKEVFLIKLAVVGGREIPWLDILGLFLFIAGFVIGLGAVTVIDLHGFLGRKSKYWTEATVRTHKVTKPLIWIGTFLATIGGVIYYRVSGLSSTATFHLFILIILVLNGLFLTFYVSPYLLKKEKEAKAKELLPKSLQIKITISFIISFLGWWSALFLLVWHLLIVR